MSAAAEFSWMPSDSGTELGLLFAHAPVGVAQCQPGGEITLLNPVLERMFNRSSHTERATYFADLVHPYDRPAGERLLREMFEGKRNSFQFDSRNPGETDQSVRWTAWRLPERRSSTGSAILLVQRVEPNRGDEPRASQAQRLEAVGRLAGGVAHDFNNLLTGVLLYCDLLMAGLDAEDRARRYVEEIRSAGVQATGLVKQLLSVVRPADSGPRLLSLNEIAQGVQDLLLRLIGENIRLEFHLDPTLGLVRMDHTQAQQILLNLVLNARDAMPGGGHILVETSNCRVQVLRESGFHGSVATFVPCALFAVEDNGRGMDAATRARVFEPFFTTKGGKGTGLGLATVHDIVTSNGGLIHVDSQPGRGTRVSVLLPLVPSTAANSQNESPRLPERNEGVLPITKKESREESKEESIL